MINKDFKLILLCVVISVFILLTASYAVQSLTALPLQKTDGDIEPFIPASSYTPDFTGGARPAPMIIRSENDLYIPEIFNITRPAEKLMTSYDKYFITGTSNPDLPVYFGKEEITRPGIRGTFGVLVELEPGENSFTFSQGRESRTVAITRREDKSGKAVPITGITQDSMVPAVFSGVRAGKELQVGCIAPSGAKVTAEFGGRTVALEQVAATQVAGIPAFFKAAIAVGGDYDDDITQNAGKVMYTMTLDGETRQYKSSGDVYVAGKNSRIAVRVTNYLGFVYQDKRNLSVFRERLKQGAVDYVRSEDNTYAELASGGYIPKEQVKVIEGVVKASGKLSGVTPEAFQKGESYAFHCPNNPVYVTRPGNDTFSVTFFNVTGAPTIDISDSSLFSEVEISSGENFVTYTLTLKEPGTLWGYNIRYGDGYAVLGFRYKPKLVPGLKPLSGVTAILDAGHGGRDPGALGVANKTGPTEADVNLAHVKAARKALEDMGANVILTRGDDTFYSLDYRLGSPEEHGADLFLSIHHNSVLENIDANKVTGVEVYYHTPMSKPLADAMMSSLVSGMNRPRRILSQSYYRVTLSSYSPALLLELGFMSHPLEYERAASEIEMNKAVRAIADGIKRALA